MYNKTARVDLRSGSHRSKNPGMASPPVSLQEVAPRKLAAVRRLVAIGDVGRVWRPALDEVWAFLRTQPGLHSGGHNVFLYHHPAERTQPMQVDLASR